MKTKHVTRIALSLGLLFVIAACPAVTVGAQAHTGAGNDHDAIYRIAVPRMTGETATLRQYEGQVLLIVNTASRCGYTGQLAGLQELHQRYNAAGFTVLAFPSNSFRQELSSDAEIAAFCEANFGTTFPLYSQVSVRGRDIHPLFAYLTSPDTNPEFAGDISWNFNKFLIDREGRVVNRFDTRTDPLDSRVLTAIQTALES